MNKRNNFANVNKKKKIPGTKKNPGNQHVIQSRVSKCDICLVSSIGYCKLSPQTCGDNFTRDNYVSLSSGKMLDQQPDGRKRKR